MLHDSMPKQIKTGIAQWFSKKHCTLKHTVVGWRTFSLKIIANWWYDVAPVLIGGALEPLVSIDETYWRRMVVNKSMAGRKEKHSEPCWIWLACEVLRKDDVIQQQDTRSLQKGNVTISRIVLRLMRSRDDAVDGKPRGVGKITRLAKEHGAQ